MSKQSAIPPRDPHSPLSREIFERIDTEAITPTPRFVFLLKDSIFWGAWVLSCVIGMGAVAASLFVVQNAGFRFYAATHENLRTFLVETAPMVWLASLLAFTGIAYYNFRHTRHGYRYPLLAIIAFSVLASIGGGAVLHTLGISQTLEETIGGHLPFHRPLSVMQQEWWVRPERGLLAGEITEIGTGSPRFRLQAFDGSVWEIQADDLRGPDFGALTGDTLVRLVGVPPSPGDLAGHRFHACFMFPWDVPPPPLFHRNVPPDGEMRFTHPPAPEERSEECQGVAPYHRLKMLQE